MNETKPTAESVAAGIIAEIRKDEALMACKNFAELRNHCVANTLRSAKEVLAAEGLEKGHEILTAAQTEVNLWLVANAIECRPHWNSVDMDVESHSAAFLLKHGREASWEAEESVCDELWFDDIYLKIRSAVKTKTGK